MRNVSRRGYGEEGCYWEMFLIIAEIFSKCGGFFNYLFLMPLFFPPVTFSGAECK